jgi:hypothetical protein
MTNRHQFHLRIYARHAPRRVHGSPEPHMVQGVSCPVSLPVATFSIFEADSAILPISLSPHPSFHAATSITKAWHLAHS